jgi:GNAT superfamily N-acetyltransferase
MPMLTLRDATPQDEADWRRLWAAYQKFYAVDLAPEITDRTWGMILSPEKPLQARLAVLDGAICGFALHHTHISTWALAEDCYLEDLFVAADTRGHGIGRALMDDLVGICRTRGYSRLYWHTDEGNSRARALYDSYTPTDGHLRYRITF